MINAIPLPMHRLAIPIVAVLAGCATAPPPSPVASLVAQAKPLPPETVAAFSKSPQDDSCLTDAQRAEIQTRTNQLIRARVEEMSMTLAARLLEMKNNKLPSLPAAKEFLQRCEAKTAVDAAQTPVPPVDPCSYERQLLADVENRVKLSPQVIAGNSFAKTMGHVSAIRAEYPNCDKKKTEKPEWKSE